MTTAQRVIVLVLGLCMATAGTAAAGIDTRSTELRVLTFNIWTSGSDGDVSAIVDAIEASEANIVALQETEPTTTSGIAEALGWNHTSSGGDVDVISSFPIENEWTKSISHGAMAVSAEIQNTLVYSVHLDYRDYGPYNACLDNDSKEAILAAEQTREQQAREIEKWATSTRDFPQIIAGDFNTPSHLDWTESTRSQHCGYAIEWPATKVFADQGWEDSFRVAHPDELSNPGNTWSPVKKWHDDGHTVPEPQDRIDMILYEGDELAVTDSSLRGGGPSWPSDHYAVLTTFTLN